MNTAEKQELNRIGGDAYTLATLLAANAPESIATRASDIAYRVTQLAMHGIEAPTEGDET